MSIDIASIDMVSEVNMVSYRPRSHYCDHYGMRTAATRQLWGEFSARCPQTDGEAEIRVSPVRLFTCCSASPEGN